MASLKFAVAFLALSVAIVNSTPCMKKKPLVVPVNGPLVPVRGPLIPVKACPDDIIRRYFDEVRVTVFSDYDWIQAQIKAIAAQKAAAEYAAIVELLNQLEAAKKTFDTDYGVVQTETFERVIAFRNKYSPLSISYTERIVVTRRSICQRLHPDLRAFRGIYLRMMPLFNDFYTKYNIERLIRARHLPRSPEYSFSSYLPPSVYANDIGVLTSTVWKDYNYVRDLINKIEYAKGSPEYELKMRLQDGLIDNWVDFDNNRRELEAIYYQRFLDAGENAKAIDDIYLEYIAKLRGHTYKFGNGFFDYYGQVEDFYRKNKLPLVAFIDFDLINAEKDVRSLYLPSSRLSKYYTKLIVTSRMDYLTAKRMWDNLNLGPDSPEYKLRNKVLPELKQRLDNLEAKINLNIRDAFRKLYEDYGRNPDVDFDKEYEKAVLDLIALSDKGVVPTLYEFKEYFYLNDDTLAELLAKKGITDATRQIIACDTYGYDTTIMIPDNDLRDLFKWSENLLKQNYYYPLNDLIQLKFAENTDEWKLRQDSLARLEKVWFDYRTVTNYATRKYINMVRKNKYALNSPEWERELKAIREHCRPKMVSIIDKFKKDAFDINGYLDTLYNKQVGTSFVRSWTYVETSFEITTTTSTSTSVTTTRNIGGKNCKCTC